MHTMCAYITRQSEPYKFREPIPRGCNQHPRTLARRWGIFEVQAKCKNLLNNPSEISFGISDPNAHIVYIHHQTIPNPRIKRTTFEVLNACFSIATTLCVLTKTHLTRQSTSFTKSFEEHYGRILRQKEELLRTFCNWNWIAAVEILLKLLSKDSCGLQLGTLGCQSDGA